MRNEEIKEYLNANFQGVRAEMKADRDIFNLKIDQVIENQKTLMPKVHANTVWRIRITAIGSAVATIVGFILFKFSNIISTIKNIGE